MGRDALEHEFLQHLGSWTKEGDGPVRSTLSFQFSWFEQREDYGVFPYGWEAGLLEGQIVQFGQGLNAKRAQVLELMDGEAISAWGGGVLAVGYGIAHHSWSEGSFLKIELVVFVDAS